MTTSNAHPDQRDMHVTDLEAIMEAVDERVRQYNKGYTPEHDDQEGFPHFEQVLDHILDEDRIFGEDGSPEILYESFTQVAATAIAMMSWWKRNPDQAAQFFLEAQDGS